MVNGHILKVSNFGGMVSMRNLEQIKNFDRGGGIHPLPMGDRVNDIVIASEKRKLFSRCLWSALEDLQELPQTQPCT